MTRTSLRGWRRVVGDIALLTALLQILAPLMLSLAPSPIGTARAATSLESPDQTSIARHTAICTAGGLIYLQLDGEDRGSIPVSADCPFCHLHHVLSADLPREQTIVVRLVAHVQPSPTTHQDIVRPAPWRTGIPTRAPPH